MLRTTLTACLGALLLVSSRVTDETKEEVPAAATAAAVVSPDTPEQLAHEIQIDPLGLELSVDIVDLVDHGSGGDLLERVQALRRKVAMEIGILIPPVRTRDNIELPSRTYVIKLFGIDSELKLEARNLTGQNYKEYQTNGTNTVIYNQYDIGRQVTLGWSVNF